MVVYADILIVLNLIVDYFLIKISNKILGLTPKIWRILLSSLIGALFSLYIFLPNSHILAEGTVRLFMITLMVLACYGFKNVKCFLKATGVLFGVTCLYAGIMIALWQIFKPRGMVIHNSVVYFDISPIVLIGATVVGYIAFLGLSKFFSASAKFAEKSEITLYADGKSVGATAIIDTGNSLTDLFGKSEIIVVDKAVLKALFNNLDISQNEDIKARFRSVPCGTVSGTDLLQGFRVDKAKIIHNGKAIMLNKPIAVISKTPLKENYSAILNPKTINSAGEENGKTEMLSV